MRKTVSFSKLKHGRYVRVRDKINLVFRYYQDYIIGHMLDIVEAYLDFDNREYLRSFKIIKQSLTKVDR